MFMSSCTLCGTVAACTAQHEKRRVHYNARVALPLSLSDIWDRLHAGYYRREEALK